MAPVDSRDLFSFDDEDSSSARAAMKSAGSAESATTISSNTGYEAEFFQILNNGTMYEKSHRRTRGFVVLARSAEVLQPLQALCLDRNRTINTCLTARYRLRSGPVFGTLLKATAADLLALGDAPHSTALLGDLLPDTLDRKGTETWSRLRSREMLRFLANGVRSSEVGEGSAQASAIMDQDTAGGLDLGWVDGLCQLLGESLRSQSRLVLFCEIAGDPGSLEEWQETGQFLFQRLPERVGVVLSGAPSGFALPKGDPHFLELDLPPLPVAAKTNAYRFVPSALTGDRPATEDRLGISPAAEALARLVLHPETLPFTIGIIAEWGRGKSSFLNLIRAALVRLVVEKARPELVTQFHDATDDITRLEVQLLSSDLHSAAEPPEQGSIEPVAGELALARSELEKKIRRRERLREQLEREASRDIVLVEFNAWRYQDSKQIWAGLAKEATERVERALPRRARWWAPFVYMARKHRAELIIGVLLPSAFAAIVAAVGLAVGLGRSADRVSDELPAIGLLLQVFLPVGSVLFTLWFIAWRAYQVLGPVSQRVLKYVRMPEYADQLGFQEQVLADLRFLRQRLTKRRLRLARREGQRGVKLTRNARVPSMVVFVDDLDRCTDEKIREVLQTINLVLGASEFFVFLAIDTTKIYPAIEAMYSDAVLKEDPRVAVRYLEKILQLSFLLPATDADHRASLIADLFSIEARRGLVLAQRSGGAGFGQSSHDSQGQTARHGAFGYDLSVLARPQVLLMQEVQDTLEELRVFEDLRDFIVDNPREIKRLVNVHRLVKILLQRPESPFEITTQRKLVVWLIFCARWPLKVGQVLQEARTCPPKENPFLGLTEESSYEDAQSVRSFCDLVDKDGALLAEDLRPGSILMQAALISQMTRTYPLSPAREAPFQVDHGQAEVADFRLVARPAEGTGHVGGTPEEHAR